MNQLSLSLRFLPRETNFMNLCIALPMWRPHGRRDRGGYALRTRRALAGACVRLCMVSHSVLCRSAALTPLEYNIHSIRSTLVRYPYLSCLRTLEKRRLRSSQCAERTIMHNRWQAHGVRAACGKARPPDSRPQGRHIGNPLDFSRVRDSAFCL